MPTQLRYNAASILAVGLCLSLAGSANAATYYVDDDMPGGVGTSWETAFKYLQDAIDVAGSGDTIRVAAGNYRPDQGASVTIGDRDATLQLETGVSIQGGYYGCPGADCSGYDPDFRLVEYLVTTLDGDLDGDDSYSSCSAGVECLNMCMDGKLITPANNGENSKHVVTGTGTDNSAVLDGVTITAGNSSQAFAGGGMYNDNGSPTVNNCTFLRNAAATGGGMFNGTSSSPIVTNCKFRGNRATDGTVGQGGAMHNQGSSAPTIPGASPTITDCLFEFNYSKTAGGAMYNNPWAAPFINRCRFNDNEASFLGSAIYNCYGQPVVVRSWFVGNRGVAAYAQYDGTIELDHCVFSGNREGALDLGVGAAGMSYVYNTVFTGNRKSGPGTIIDTDEPITFTNCVGFDNSPGGASQVKIEWYGSVAFSYSNIEGGTGQSWFGTGCIDDDPEFDTDGYWDDNILTGNPIDDCWVEGDYRLTSTSPCIDSAEDDSVQPDVGDADGDANTAEQTPRDLASGARFAEGDGSEPEFCQRTASDMGPFEFQGACSIHADCVDCNQCTTGTCLIGTCYYYNVAAGTACDSGLACTVNDVCDGDGVCLDIPDPCQLDVDCDDCNDCTIDTCASGVCSYVDATAGTGCDDGLFCTAVDTCDGAGACSGTGSPCTPLQICSEFMDICINGSKGGGS